MMSGRVEDNRALVTLILRGPFGAGIGIEFQVDTAFRGYLTLPSEAVAMLQMPFLHRMAAGTADNRTVLVDVHQATVTWNGIAQEVEALAMGRRPLIGAALLDGCRLTIDFVENGAVQIANIKLSEALNSDAPRRYSMRGVRRLLLGRGRGYMP
jgi:clan AA aspartic protease